MIDKYKASSAYRALYEELKTEEQKGPIHRERVSGLVAKSPQTLKQYSADPDKAVFRLPPIEVIDKMRECVMQSDVYGPSGLKSLGSGNGFTVRQLAFSDYLSALDYADRSKLDVRPRGTTKVPKLSKDAQLRHRWRLVFFGGIADRYDLAAISRTDIYDVPWVGREHPCGIQPTFAMVAAAIALEAAMSARSAA